MSRSPLLFSEGVGGFAFYDQLGRLIVLVTRTTESKDALNATITLRGLKDGEYTVADLCNEPQTFELSPKGGEGKLALPLERWDTRVLAVFEKGKTPSATSGSEQKPKKPKYVLP